MSVDRGRRHAERAEELLGDDGDAAAHAALAVYYAAEETNQLLTQLLVRLSGPATEPGTPGTPPARPQRPGPDPSPLRPPGPPPRPGLPPEM